MYNILLLHNLNFSLCCSVATQIGESFKYSSQFNVYWTFINLDYTKKHTGILFISKIHCCRQRNL